MTYGYDPFRGTEQFYDCELPSDYTAPITLWMRDRANRHFVDVRMPEGNVIRSLTAVVAEIYVSRGGVILPDNPQ